MVCMGGESAGQFCLSDGRGFYYCLFAIDCHLVTNVAHRDG